MAAKELIIGKRALFNHCDMGVVQVLINEKLPEKEGIYQGRLLEIRLEKVRSHQMALNAMASIGKGQEVSVIVQSSTFICYVEWRYY